MMKPNLNERSTLDVTKTVLIVDNTRYLVTIALGPWLLAINMRETVPPSGRVERWVTRADNAEWMAHEESRLVFGCGQNKFEQQLSFHAVLA